MKQNDLSPIKKVGVLFSGGLDSTYLIWDNLEKGNIVKPIYIEITNNSEKLILEKNRVERICELFHKNYGDRIERVKYKLTFDVYPEDHLYFKQVPIWIIAMLYTQQFYDELQIGYVIGDDAISFLGDFKKLYKQYNKINDNKLIPLKFPLKKKSKMEINEELPSEYKNLVVSCESPKLINTNVDVYQYEPCGKCPPCVKILNGDVDTLNKEYYKVYITKAFETLLEYKNVEDNSFSDIKVLFDDEDELIKITKPYHPNAMKKASYAYQKEIEFPEYSLVEPKKISNNE